MQDERRSKGDRRRRPTPWMSRYWLTGRRRGARRASEAVGQYVDRYRWSEWALVLGILALCIADYWLTLEIVKAGGSEANPLMEMLLAKGHGVFGLVKIGVTLLGVLFLLIHIRFRRVNGVTQVLLMLYCLLMLWHLWVRWDMFTLLQGRVGPAP